MSHWEPEEQDEATHVYQPGFNVHASHAAAQAHADAEAADRWFISRDGRAKEVLSAREIIESTQAGVLSEDALVWRDGLSDWTPLGQVPELMRAVHAFVAPAGALPPPPVFPGVASRPGMHRTLPPMPSLPPIGSLPPVPSLPPPPAAFLGAARHPGQTSQPVVVGYNQGQQRLIPWSQPVEVPVVGATPLRALVLFAGVALGGIALGALMFDGRRAPKPLVISGDVGTSREVVGALQARPAAPVFAPAANAAVGVVGAANLGAVAAGAPAAVVGVVPGSLPLAGDPRDSRQSLPEAVPVAARPANPEPVARAVNPEPVARFVNPEPVHHAAPPEPVTRPAAPEPAPVRGANLMPPRALTPEPEHASAPVHATERDEPEEPEASEPARSKDPLVEAMRQRIKPGSAEAASEPEEKPAKASSGGDFDLDAAKAVLSSAAARAAKCQPKGGPTGTGSVRVILSPSGNVSSVSIQTPKFDGTATGSCVQMVFRQVKVPPFTGSEKSVSKKFTIP